MAKEQKLIDRVIDASGFYIDFGIDRGSEALDKIGANYDTPKADRVLFSEVNGLSRWKRVTQASSSWIRYIQCIVIEWSTNVTTGDGKFYVHIPTELNGMDLVYVHGEVITAGTTGTTDIQIANATDSVDMLSTKLTIDSGETGSDTAATAAVIDTAKDDVATNDLLRIDVDAVSTTKPKGLIVTLGFRLP